MKSFSFESLRQTGILPVVVLEEEKDALPLGQALIDGGLPAAEVTFRTKAAASAIRTLSDHYPELLVGAGTVLTKEQADQAVDCGARFVVSPGYDDALVRHCLDRGIAVCPGTMTPGEMMAALNAGLTHVKFFPAAQMGGIATIEAIGAAFGSLSFMPTGGIGADTVADYLKSPRVFCCGGSWMVKKELIRSGDFSAITKKVREAVDLVRRVRNTPEGE